MTDDKLDEIVNLILEGEDIEGLLHLPTKDLQYIVDALPHYFYTIAHDELEERALEPVSLYDLKQLGLSMLETPLYERTSCNETFMYKLQFCQKMEEFSWTVLAKSLAAIDA